MAMTENWFLNVLEKSILTFIHLCVCTIAMKWQQSDRIKTKKGKIITFIVN